MNQEEIYKKTEEIIAKFKNGKERYHVSAMFNQVVQMLVRDVDLYDVIDQLIYAAEDSTKALEQYMIRTVPPEFKDRYGELHNLVK